MATASARGADTLLHRRGAAVVFVFTPHLFTLAVTISFVLLASLFYPSRIVISLWKNKADRKMLLEDTEMLIIYYY